MNSEERNNLIIEKSHILIVEGDDEKGFFLHY